MTENPARCEYAYARALLCMPVSKRCISCEIQKSVVSHDRIFADKGVALICAMQRIDLSLFHVDL